MNNKTIRMLSLTVALISFLGLGQLNAQGENVLFGEAKEILQKMSNFLSSADQFSFHAYMTDEIQFYKDYYIRNEVRSEVTISRPDKVYAEIKSDYNHKRYWYDGQKITLLTVPANLYASANATGDIGEMTDFVYDNYGVRIPLASLAFENPYSVLMDGVVDGYYTGLHSVDGVLCHHLLFINEDAEWQIWIEDGLTPVPRKYLVKYNVDDKDFVFVAAIDNWKFNGYAPDEMFNFVAPPGAGIIEFIK